jgi:hypothetical protein
MIEKTEKKINIPDVAQNPFAKFGLAKTTVSHILQEGVQKCIFDIKDIRLMAEIIVVALKGLELSWTIEKTEFEIKNEINMLLNVLFKGIETKE